MKLTLNRKSIFRWVLIIVCISLCFIGRFIPEVNGFTSEAWSVVFIFIGVIILWLFVGIDWPSLLCLFALGFIDKLNGFKGVFANSFGNQTFVFLLFTFVCTYALTQTSLIKRVAITFVNSKLAKRSGNWFIFLFLFAVLLLGMFMSPSVLFVAILPILNQILEVAGISKEDKIAKTLMLGLGFTVSISSGMTTIGHVFPILAMSVAELNISPITYMAFGIPVGLIIFFLMLGMFKLFLKPDVNKFKEIDVSELKEKLPSIDAKDIITISVFALVIVLWTLPPLFQNVLPEFAKAMKNYGTAMPPLLGTLLLCIIRVEGKPIIRVGDALKNGVPWPALIMCAATLALGSALTNNAIGITTYLKDVLSTSLATLPVILLLIIFVTWAAIQTNVSSNMITATLVASVAWAILESSNLGINAPALLCIIGMMASFAFATPPSMPHIAIVAGSESTNTKEVLLYGGILMIISIVIALLIGYPIASLVL